MANSVKLLRKLSLKPDLSVDREESKIGSVKHLMATVKKNYTSCLLMNLLFALFILPLAFVILFLLPQLEAVSVSGLNFVGDIGMGFPGAVADTNVGKLLIYDMRIIVAACCIPGFTLAGIGAAGVFYCSRNLLWGAKVKLRRQFWRGIKKYWWQYAIAFTLLGVMTFLTYFSITNHLILSVNGSAPWWSYLLMIGVSAFSLLILIWMMFYLPIIVRYRYSYGETIKNSTILSLVMFVIAGILVVMLGLPLLLMINSFTQILLGMFMIFMGFSLYIMAISAFGQYTCDTFINPLYKQEQEEKLKIERKNYKKVKAKTVIADSNKKNKK